MSLTALIVTVFVIGYLFITLEAFTKVNKAAIALLMFVACWVLYTIGADTGYFEIADGAASASAYVNSRLLAQIGETGEILFFLMGAMTIVEVVDSNGGFDFVRKYLTARSKRVLLWKIAIVTFILSAILDNMTTSIVLVMILRKLVSDKKERMLYAAVIIIAANAGGAPSPIGDVTTIMLWIAGNITTVGILSEMTIPAIVSLVIPVFILQFSLHGKLGEQAQGGGDDGRVSPFTAAQRKTVFLIGVGGLIFVPIFRGLTDLPPFVGILLILGLLWATIGIFNRSCKDVPAEHRQSVTKCLSRIDISTILFFLGILLAVGSLSEIGVLQALGQWLDKATGGNDYLITGAIGFVSSVVDNVPLVAGAMKMYVIDPASANLAVDGIFWQLLAYCAGVGGSMLIIGSAAGVVVMGLEKITFGWYLRHISWVVVIGYLSGIVTYWLMRTVF